MAISSRAPQPELAPSVALPQHVKRALGHLRTNMTEKVTLAELATASGISQLTLTGGFYR